RHCRHPFRRCDKRRNARTRLCLSRHPRPRRPDSTACPPRATTPRQSSHTTSTFPFQSAPAEVRFTCARTAFQHSKSVQNAAFPPFFAHFVRKRAEPKLVFHLPRSYEGTGHSNKKNAVTA